MTERWDAVVLGGGPAGLSAAFHLARAGRRTLLVERGRLGGKCARLGRIASHPAFPGGVSGAELALRLTAQARAHGAVLRAGEAEAVEAAADGLLVRLADGTLRARAVVAATGTEFLPLGLSGEERWRGLGLEHAPFERARLWAGRAVGVAGGGETAVHQALRLAEAGARVRLFVRGEGLKAVAPLRLAAARQPRLRVLTRTRVTALHGGARLEAVSLAGPRGASRARLDALFVLVGQRPSLPRLPAREGVFLAGDAAGEARQTAVAAASGLARAMAADAWLGRR